jgi:hypothetical protein
MPEPDLSYERRLLQLDHVIPDAEGGEQTVANLRLRCRAHNLHTARAHFGRESVRAAAERARETGRARRVGLGSGIGLGVLGSGCGPVTACRAQTQLKASVARKWLGQL